MFKIIHIRKCYVEVPYILSNGAGEEARRKRIKSLSAKLGQAFACLASGAFYCVVYVMTFYEIIMV